MARRAVDLPVELRDLCGSVYVLKDYADPARCEGLLMGAFVVCAPVMRKRGWRIGTLCEMVPTRSSIYGLNEGAGRVIRLRLREPGDSKQLLPAHSVLHTFLHELCHNVHGSHSADFYDLLDLISDEAACV